MLLDPDPKLRPLCYSFVIEPPTYIDVLTRARARAHTHTHTYTLNPADLSELAYIDVLSCIAEDGQAMDGYGNVKPEWHSLPVDIAMARAGHGLVVLGRIGGGGGIGMGKGRREAGGETSWAVCRDGSVTLPIGRGQMVSAGGGEVRMGGGERCQEEVSLMAVGGFSEGQHLKSSELITLSLPRDDPSCPDAGGVTKEVEVEVRDGDVSGLVSLQDEGLMRVSVGCVCEDGPPMLFKRSGAAVVALGNGSMIASGNENGAQGRVGVYAIGGFSGVEALKLAEVLEVEVGGGGKPCVGKWREVHMMSSARFGATGVCIPGVPESSGGEGGGGTSACMERIAVFGGFDGENILRSAAVFTPHRDVTCSGGYGEWKNVTDMPRVRMACASVFFGGKVYVIGGSTEKNALLSTVDEWDPGLDVWSRNPAVPSLPSARKDACAFVFRSEIWLVGGSDAQVCI